MNPKKVIAVFFVLAILALAIGFGAMWYNSQQGPDGRYNYSFEKVEYYYIEGTDIPIVSGEDTVFYKTEITLKNDRFDPGMKTEEIAWKMTVDGYTVSQHLLSVKNVDFKNVTVQKGETVNFVVMFEIPKNMLGQKTELGYVYLTENTSLKYDQELIPVNVQVSDVYVSRCASIFV